jgi:hypothetical protein
VQPPPPAKKKGWLWKVVIPLIVVLAGGGGVGGWWWMTQRETGISGGVQMQAGQTDPAAATEAAETTQESAAAAAAAESTAAEATPPEPATVTIAGMLPSGLVTVDGVAQSSQEFQVTPGELHVIQMRQAGYETIVDTVTFEAGQSVRYPYVGRDLPRPAQTETQTQRPAPQRPAAPQTGIVQIRVRPWANVFIGAEEFPQTARVVDTLVAGQPHNIRFRRDGFAPKDTVVILQPNETVTINVRLQEGG